MLYPLVGLDEVNPTDIVVLRINHISSPAPAWACATACGK